MVQQEPVPDPDNVFPRLAKARFFSKFDLSKGYWQFKLHTSCRHLTAFSSPIGKLQWTVLGFVLASAPSTFTKLMRQVTQGRDDIISCMDDMFLFHTILKEHIQGVNQILGRIRGFGLTIHPKKNMHCCQRSNFPRIYYQRG